VGDEPIPFLEREWLAVLEAAGRAEAAAHAAPRSACFYARRALELAVAWAHKHDAAPAPGQSAEQLQQLEAGLRADALFEIVECVAMLGEDHQLLVRRRGGGGITPAP
jgi:type I restriction enzyme R subunit